MWGQSQINLQKKTECGVRYNKSHRLINCKSFDLYNTYLKTIVNDTLQLHSDKSVTVNMNVLLGETIFPAEPVLTIKTLLIDFL